jgi:hypothetical protein
MLTTTQKFAIKDSVNQLVQGDLTTTEAIIKALDVFMDCPTDCPAELIDATNMLTAFNEKMLKKLTALADSI